MDGQVLGRGQSAHLSVNSTLYLVNQSYPFTVQFSGSADRKTGKGSDDNASTQKVSDGNVTKVHPKRNIQDFFVSSPKKVSFIDSNTKNTLDKIRYHYIVYALLYSLSQQKEPWIPKTTHPTLNVDALRNLMKMKRSCWRRSSDSCRRSHKAQAYSRHHHSPVALRRLPA